LQLDIQPGSTSGTTEVLLSPADLADRWGCSVGWLANQRCEGDGPPYLKLGSLVRYRLSDVVAYEDAAEQPVRSARKAG